MIDPFKFKFIFFADKFMIFKLINQLIFKTKIYTKKKLIFYQFKLI